MFVSPRRHHDPDMSTKSPESLKLGGQLPVILPGPPGWSALLLGITDVV